MAMEEGARAQTPDKNTYSNSKKENGTQGEENWQKESPQIDTAQHYLDDNFSDVMRSSALGSNVSSLFNTTTFTTTHSEQKVTLDWILLDGKNSQLETLRDRHIMDFPAPGGNTGAMLVYLPDLEPFYNTKEFLVDLQSGELFVKLNSKWHPAGLTCEKRNFEVDGLMALIQHASIRLKNKIYGRKEDQTTVLTLDPTETQPPPLPFIPRVANYMLHSKPMSPTMRKNYIKDRAQAAVTYITEYGNTALWSLENLVPLHKLTQCLQVVFGRVDAVRKAVDEAIEKDDEIRRKKCMHYLKPPKRFPRPEDMESEETATWINWIHMETQALLEDLNEEIKLQNTADDPFTKHIVYAPTQSTQKTIEFQDSQQPVRKQIVNSEIPPSRQERQIEEKLASPLLTENTGKPLPQHTNNQRGKIPPTTRDVRNKPPTYTARTNNTRRQINYDSMNWDGNNTSYMPLPSGRQQVALEQFSINNTTDIRLCYRCGEEGHIRKYCNTNVHCEFCKSYTHHTSVCRSYANFMRAHPMASSRRTSPAQANRQQEWTQEPNEEVLTSNIKTQNFEENTEEREGERRRELSEITRRQLERVINTMIPSSTCSSMDPVDSALVNSLVSQSSERGIEGGELKQGPTEKEKQVIVNNYYISDRKEGWKQLEKGEIPPNTLEGKTQRNSSEISPEKSYLGDLSTQSGVEKEVKNLDRDRRNITQAKEDPRGFYGEGAEVQNMSPPPTYNPIYPPPARYSGNQDTAAMLDCIRQLQLTVQQHVLTNSKQAEYHMLQNADLFTEMARGQKRRDLDPAIMAIPTFTG